uniref:Uncharacterized protein n=1 Tax=Rhizophora mucronata TaxID=61149 RepID=A0A2P2PRI8_RHIMU
MLHSILKHGDTYLTNVVITAQLFSLMLMRPEKLSRVGKTIPTF